MVAVVALCLSLAGYLFIAYKRRFGFVVWFLSNILWIASEFTTSPFSQACRIAMFAVYMAVNVFCWINWKKAKK